jgi:hypothetical protein
VCATASVSFSTKAFFSIIFCSASVRFYAALAEAEETLMPVLCQKSQVLSTQFEIDGRLIPTLSRFLAVGGDDVFEGLCVLAKRIDIPEILPILEGLLHRWIQRFDIKAVGQQNEESDLLWRGFARLTEHSQFNAIPDWPQELEAVLLTWNGILDPTS